MLGVNELSGVTDVTGGSSFVDAWDFKRWREVEALWWSLVFIGCGVVEDWKRDCSVESSF